MLNSFVGKAIGQYEIIREIGRGGMSVVYEAYHPSLNRRVAIKILSQHLTSDETFVQRFLQEARTAARLDHSNIVTIYDVGMDAGYYYIVMKKLEGEPLNDLVRQMGRLPLARAIRIVAQIASALDYAHRQGIVHRDIKPGNIIVGVSDQATLTDFGIAKATESTQLTRTGTSIGTPEYMSPEQASGKPVGPASDIYSLGIVLYQMLAGRVPFQADSAPALLHKQVYEQPLPVRRLVPDLPPRIDGVVAQALAKAPERRFGTAGEMARALCDTLSPQPTAPVRSGAATVMVRLIAQAKQFIQGKPVLAGLLALAPVLVVAAIAALSSSKPPGAPPVATIAPGTAIEQRWADAQTSAQAGAWADALAIIAEIRDADVGFQVEDVQGLRATACGKLARQSEQEADVAGAQRWWGCVLEERPGDADAFDGYRRTRLYLDGLDAFKVQDFIGAIAAWKPLHAESGDYADVADKLYAAYLAYGDGLCAKSVQDAQSQYDLARQLDPTRREADDRAQQCQAPVASPAPSPRPTSSPTPLPGPHLATVTGSSALRVRSGPGLGYFVLGKLEASTGVTISGRTADSSWMYVEAAPDRRGWVDSTYLDAQYPLAAAPIVAPPPLPRQAVVADAQADFSSQQGFQDWFYLMSTSAGALDFTRMPWDGDKWYRWCYDARYDPQMRLSSMGGYPGWQYDVARLWVSPYEGELRISGRAYKEQGAGRGGNGVYVRIMQNENMIWGYGLGGYDTNGASLDLTVFSQPGDKFYFIINALGNDDQDNTVFNPTIELINANGVDQPLPTRWSEVGSGSKQATPTPPPAPTVMCFKPQLRHFEEHKGSAAEVAGLVYDRQGRLFGPRCAVVRIEGPPATDQYTREFGVDAGGGYSITALSVDVYMIWLKGPNIRSEKYVVQYTDWATIRAIVDFYQVACW